MYLIRRLTGINCQRRLDAGEILDGFVAGTPELPLRIIVDNPPRGVTFQMQRGKQDLAPPVRRTADALVFEFTVRVGRRPTGEPNFLGPFAQGPPAARFVYINSGTLAGQAESCWSRRAKVPLTGITWPMVERARTSHAVLEAHIQGAGRDGSPTCATVRPIEPGWRVTRGHGRDAE